MARSAYIYAIYENQGLVAVFTVKREAQEWLRAFPHRPRSLIVERHADNPTRGKVSEPGAAWSADEFLAA